MGFERTKMTEEEKIEVYTILNNNSIQFKISFELQYRTINREKNIYLIYIGDDTVYRNKKNNEYYVLVWKDLVTTALISRVFEDNFDTNLLNLVHFTIIEGVNYNNNILINDLKEALTTYSYDGKPGSGPMNINDKLIIKFSF